MTRSPTPRSVLDAERMQREIARQVAIPAGQVSHPRMVAGLDVSYARGSDRIAAAAVLVELATGTVQDEVVIEGRVSFSYVAGLLAFREAPILLEALSGLAVQPDVLICDGQGIAHPRRCGLACHLGVLAGLAAIGCAKNHFHGAYAELGPHRGQRVPLIDANEAIGEVLRTQDHVKPVYVSPGHSIGVTQASDIVLTLCSRYRIPDPVRHADHISRLALK